MGVYDLRAKRSEAKRSEAKRSELVICWFVKTQNCKKRKNHLKRPSPTHNVFRNSKLDTVASSGKRIFFCEGGCSGTVQIRAVYTPMCELKKTQKTQKKANH